MTINIKNIILAAIAVMLFILLFKQCGTGDRKTPEKETVTIEGQTKTVYDTIKVVERDTVFLPSEDDPETRIEYVVDKEYKNKYEQAKDSLEQARLFIEAITVKDYSGKIFENDTIRIDGKATVRGELLDYSIKYDIKDQEFTYTPKTYYRRPSLSVGIGGELGIPTEPDNNMTLKGTIYLENSTGWGLSVGYDTQKTIWAGLRKNFKLAD